LHPREARCKSYVEMMLKNKAGPVVTTANCMRNYADRIRSHNCAPLCRAGDDDFGGSDYPVKLRQLFEVNRCYVTLAALKALGAK
jgi:pyruvate dehydrogenase E1 component